MYHRMTLKGKYWDGTRLYTECSRPPQGGANFQWHQYSLSWPTYCSSKSSSVSCWWIPYCRGMIILDPLCMWLFWTSPSCGQGLWRNYPEQDKLHLILVEGGSTWVSNKGDNHYWKAVFKLWVAPGWSILTHPTTSPTLLCIWPIHLWRAKLCIQWRSEDRERSCIT